MNNERPPLILVVDDDQAPRKVMERILRRSGYAVAGADNGLEGLAQAKALHPDLIILDVEMPGMNGMSLCTHLKEGQNTHDIPVLFLTGHGTVGDMEVGLKSGAESYLSKPVDAHRFLVKVKELLDARPAKVEEGQRESGSTVTWRETFRSFFQSLRNWF